MNIRHGLLLVALCVAIYLGLLTILQLFKWADRMMREHPRITIGVIYVAIIVFLFIAGAMS